MAKSELFWFPLGVGHRGGGRVQGAARPVPTAKRSRRRCGLARDGHVIAMFPEGTRRRKGIRKKYEAQAHTGAARIALEAGVPLVPAGIRGTERAAPARPLCACATARRSSSPTTSTETTDAPDGRRSTSSRQSLVNGSAARDRRRLARAPRLPRAAEVDPAERARRLLELPAAAVGGGAAGRRCVVAWDTLEVADLPARGAAGVPVGPRVRGLDRRAARAAARRSSSRSASSSRRRAGYEADDFLAAAAARWPGPVLVATSDRDAFQLVTDRVTSCSR